MCIVSSKISLVSPPIGRDNRIIDLCEEASHMGTTKALPSASEQQIHSHLFEYLSYDIKEVEWVLWDEPIENMRSSFYGKA